MTLRHELEEPGGIISDQLSRKGPTYHPRKRTLSPKSKDGRADSKVSMEGRGPLDISINGHAQMQIDTGLNPFRKEGPDGERRIRRTNVGRCGKWTDAWVVKP